MLKSYLEYSPLNSFGVICSFPSNVVVTNGGHVITGALEKVQVWNPREAKLLQSLYVDEWEQTKKKSPIVTRVSLSSDQLHLAVGYGLRFLRSLIYYLATAMDTLRFGICNRTSASRSSLATSPRLLPSISISRTHCSSLARRIRQSWYASTVLCSFDRSL